MSLKKKVVGGTIWSSVSTASKVIVSVLRLSILTRFLERADFGLVAIVSLILGFTAIFSDLGVSVSLFSKDKITKKEYSSLYWFGLLQSGALYLIICLLAPVFVQVYGYELLYTLIPLMGLDLIFANLGRQFKIFMQKDLEFKSIAIIEIIVMLASLVVAVVLAYWGYGVFSLVYSTLVSSFLSSLLFVIVRLKKHPIIWHMSYRDNKSFYKIGFYQTGAQVLDYFANNFDIILMSKLMPPSDLGVYNLIKQLVVRVYSFVNPIISRVALPIFVKLKEDLEALKMNYVKMLNLISFANVFSYSLLAVSAHQVLTIVYGAQYSDSSHVLVVLCIWGAITSTTGAASLIIPVFGRTDLGFKWTIVRLFINPVFLYVGFYFNGFYGLVIGQTLFTVLGYVVYYRFIIKKLLVNLAFKEYLSVNARYCIIAALIGSAIIYMSTYVERIVTQPVVLLLLYSFLFSIIYLILNKSKVQLFIKYLKK